MYLRCWGCPPDLGDDDDTAAPTHDRCDAVARLCCAHPGDLADGGGPVGPPSPSQPGSAQPGRQDRAHGRRTRSPGCARSERPGPRGCRRLPQARGRHRPCILPALPDRPLAHHRAFARLPVHPTRALTFSAGARRDPPPSHHCPPRCRSPATSARLASSCAAQPHPTFSPSGRAPAIFTPVFTALAAPALTAQLPFHHRLPAWASQNTRLNLTFPNSPTRPPLRGGSVQQGLSGAASTGAFDQLWRSAR